ncbi:MAG: tetratricopeptide repeat protein [Bacteroidota bacterium]|nr:tetratricopeptide repeat protein [Bacteroidota bacterium]
MRNLITNFLFCIMILVSCTLQAQENKTSGKANSIIDSLLLVLKNTPKDTSKVKALIELSRHYVSAGSYEKALQCADQVQELSGNLNYQQGMANSYSLMGVISSDQGNYEKALAYHLKCLKISEEIDFKKGIANSYSSIGIIYWHQGNEESALDYYWKTLKIQEEIGDKRGIAKSYNNIGIIYKMQGNDEKALNSYLKCLKGMEEIGDKKGIAGSYNNIGTVYEHQKNYEKALEYYMKSLKIKEEIGNKPGTVACYINIGSVYIRLDNFEKSSPYLYQSLALSKEIGFKLGIKETYNALSDLYDGMGDYKQALEYHKLYSGIKDTLLNEQSSKQITEMNTKYDTEKKDKELIKKDTEITKQQAETDKQILQRNAFIIGFALVIVLAFFIFKGYRQKQSANKLLEEKNTLIEKQKQLVEEKNSKITDSINYAKRIQQAVLPSDVLIKSFLPESFIFFRPKDIVSGDFYWFSEKDGKLIIAVADCTGHGVPGAFMSMIGNTLLNEIVNVKNIVEPAKILDQLNKGIVKLLQQNENTSTQDDGMDISILSIDKVNNEIEFSGANHVSYLINQNQFETLKGDIFSIGGMFGRSDINFTSQKIRVEKGSTVYLCTDGFVDQFGGEKNSKFLSGRFEQLLKSVQHYDIVQQQEKLTTAFDNWKGINKQLDDILIVGIRL